MTYKSTHPIDKLHFITNQWSTIPIKNQVASFLSAGGKWVQLRLKDLTDTEINDIAIMVQDLCKTHGATFIINDRVDLALQTNADGVHLGKEDLSPTEARKLLGNGKIIGTTANSRGDLERALSLPVDYIGLGPYRFTTTKQKLAAPMGHDGFSQHAKWMQQQVNPLPMVGIGGIRPDDIGVICASGLHGVALSSCISHAQNGADITQQLIQALKNNSTC